MDQGLRRSKAESTPGRLATVASCRREPSLPDDLRPLLAGWPTGPVLFAQESGNRGNDVAVGPGSAPRTRADRVDVTGSSKTMVIGVEPSLASGSLDLFGAGAAFHHVGLVVASIDVAHPGLLKTRDPIQRVVVAFADLNGIMVELIKPAAEDSPVSAILAKGHRLAHLCFLVPDLELAANHAWRHGARPISTPASAMAFDGRRILWIFHPRFGLFELLESTRRDSGIAP